MSLIDVIFINNEEYKEVSGVWQWSYGEKLKIQGLNLPKAVEVHFSLTKEEGDSKRRIGVTEDGVTIVPVPDSMFEGGTIINDYYNVYAFIYLTTTETGKTIKRITINVKIRPEPEAFETPEEKELFKEVIDSVNESAVRAEEAQIKAENARDEAQSIANNIKTDVQGLVNEANSAKNTAIENANISASNADETESDRIEVEQNKNEVAQLKADAEQIKQDTLQAEQRVIQLMSTDTKSYFFATIAERDAATGIRNCDRCSVYETRADYIYDTENVDGDEQNPEWIKTSDWDALKTVAWDIITGKPNFATVAITGKYDDLLEIPNRYNSPVVLDGTADIIEWDYSKSDTAIVTMTADKALNISNGYNGCRASLDVYGAKLILDDETYLKSATYAYLEAVEGEHYHYEFQRIIDKWQVGMMVVSGAEAGETV